MTKLTPAQSKILADAASAKGTVDKVKGNKAFDALVARGLLQSANDPKNPQRLVLTADGHAAVPTAPKTPQDAAPLKDGPKGKLGVLLELLQRPAGMTIAQAIDATGWQAHSVRGALAGSIKKKLGHTIESEKVEGVRVYRVGTGA